MDLVVRVGSLTGFSVVAALGGVLTRDLTGEQAGAEQADVALMACEAVCCSAGREMNHDGISDSLNQLDVTDSLSIVSGLKDVQSCLPQSIPDLSPVLLAYNSYEYKNI